MSDRRPLVTKKFLELFLKHFSKGGIKSVPLVGGLAEEILSGVGAPRITDAATPKIRLHSSQQSLDTR